MAGTAMRNVRVLVAGSNGLGGATTCWMLRRIARTSSIGISAKGDGFILPPTFTTNGSPICSPKRVKGMPNRRGRRVQPLGRPGDAAFGHERLEGHEQIEVEPVEVNVIHDA